MNMYVHNVLPSTIIQNYTMRYTKNR
jgi:hypothetical protein